MKSIEWLLGPVTVASSHAPKRGPPANVSFQMPKVLRLGGYMLVTIATRGAGLVRELLLLSVIGIGRDLDSLVYVLIVPSLVTLFVASIIYTNVTPRAAQTFAETSGDSARDSKTQAAIVERLLAEGIRFGAVLTVIAALANIVLMAFAAPGDDGAQTIDYAVAGIVSVTVLFTVIAEYFSALLTAKQHVGYLVVGNLFISLPAIVALALFDLDITSYAIVFSLSFACRAAYLMIALRRAVPFRLLPWQALRSTPLPRWSRAALSAGSALIGVQLAMQYSTLVARFLPVGAVGLLYFGLRLPQLYLSTAWFVLSTDFFGEIQQLDGRQIKERVVRASAWNLGALACIYLVGVPLLQVADSLIPERWDDLRLDEIATLSLYCFPLIACIPVIDMTQKVLASIGEGHRTLRLGVVAVVAVVALATASLAVERIEALLAAMTAGLGVTAIFAARRLWHVLGHRGDSVGADPSQLVIQ